MADTLDEAFGVKDVRRLANQFASERYTLDNRFRSRPGRQPRRTSPLASRATASAPATPASTTSFVSPDINNRAVSAAPAFSYSSTLPLPIPATSKRRGFPPSA
jgi:hypothetical protein